MPTDQQKKKFAEDHAVLSQQNQEYAESLAKDLARREEREKREQRKRAIQEYRHKLKDTSFTGPQRVLVRYPNGTRSIYGFSSSDPLIRLFDAIVSNPACPDYFSVRSVYPRAEIACFPDWYRRIFNEHVERDEQRQDATITSDQSMASLGTDSILFINTIQP